MKLWDDVSKKTRIERWENVVRVLRSLTPHERRKHWNMHVWGEKTDCGTVACAAGHCSFDPWFRARGLKQNFTWFKGDEYSGPQWESDFDDESVVLFFGLEGASSIFWNSSQRPVGTVIRECLAYIKELKAAA